MDFKYVMKTLLNAFDEEKIRYALIGGFALGVHGISRATVDLDFLVDRTDLDKIEKVMSGMGYTCAYKSENVSQYVSGVRVFGEIDFIHAFRKTSLKMLDRAIKKQIFENIEIKVVKAEDLIGLKVQAAENNAKRFNHEFSDIEALMAKYGSKLDWDLLSEYFSVFGQLEIYSKLKEKYLAVK